MNDPDKKPANSGWWLVALLPVIYVLSLGPVARWDIKNPGPHPVIDWFYAPAGILEHTPLGEPLYRYVRWWER